MRAERSLVMQLEMAASSGEKNVPFAQFSKFPFETHSSWSCLSVPKRMS